MKVKILSAVVLLFFVFDALVGQITVKRISAKTKQTQSSVSDQMPNLQGDEARQFLAQQGLEKSLGEAMQAARYNVNWVEQAPVSNGSGGAFEAKNMQHNFAAYFSNDGAKLVSREAADGWSFSLKLKGYGRGEQIETLSDGEIKSEGNRVEISKSKIQNPKSKIVEWFENKPEGLEQGFVVNESPFKDGQETTGAKLKVVLSLIGDLQARISDDGQSLLLVKQSGVGGLRYDKLKSWDANGKELASRIEIDGDKLSIVVDDAEAFIP